MREAVVEFGRDRVLCGLRVGCIVACFVGFHEQGHSRHAAFVAGHGLDFTLYQLEGVDVECSSDGYNGVDRRTDDAITTGSIYSLFGKMYRLGESRNAPVSIPDELL